MANKKLNRSVTVNHEIDDETFNEIFVCVEYYGLHWAEDMIVFKKLNNFNYIMIKDEKWYYLTKQGIVNAYQKAIDEKILSVSDTEPSNIDMNTANIIAQLALFGEVRYA